MLTNASLLGLSLSRLNALANSNLLLLYQILICKTHGLPQPRQFWDTFHLELAIKCPYKASTGNMRLRLQKLQETNSEAQELRQKGLRDGLYQDINGVLYHQGLSFMPKAIRPELISRHYDNPLVSHLDIKKTRKLLT